MSLDTLGDFGGLRQLEQALERIQKLGYSLVEIDLAPFALVLDGTTRQRGLDDFLAVLSNFQLRYSVHAPIRLNLAYDPQHDLCRRILHAQLQICAAIGGNRLVYHSGLQALDGVARGARHSLLSDEELAEGAQREVQAFKDLGPVAADLGIIICMENGDSHLWEHDVMARFGCPREALLKYHPRLHPQNIVRQLEAINHPNVAMTLDIAHLYIAANDMEFDYLEAIRTAAPWVRHLHVNDNFGRLDRGFDVEYDRWAFGEGDIHMPPGWGRIPYADVFGHLPSYEGDLVLEIKQGFGDYLAESLATMRQILSAS